MSDNEVDVGWRPETGPRPWWVQVVIALFLLFAGAFVLLIGFILYIMLIHGW